MAHKKYRVNPPLSCVRRRVKRESSDSGSRLLHYVEQTSLDTVGSLTDSDEECSPEADAPLAQGVCVLLRERLAFIKKCMLAV